MEMYIKFANDNLWAELWPELSLGLGAMIVLGINLFSNSSNAQRNAGNFAVLFQFLLLLIHLFDYLLIRHTFDRESFSGMLQHGIHQDIMRSFFFVLLLLVSLLGQGFLVSCNYALENFITL